MATENKGNRGKAKPPKNVDAEQDETPGSEQDEKRTAALAAKLVADYMLNKDDDCDDGLDEPEPYVDVARTENAVRKHLMALIGPFDDHCTDRDNVDMISQSITAILGTGPAVATLETMFSGSASQSSILMNAAKMQRQLDNVALVTTASCVRHILSMNDPVD